MDPEHIWPRFGLTMDGFRKAVKIAMAGDIAAETATEEKWYRIRKTWGDAGTQLGAYHDLEKAKENCPVGYIVYDWNGKAVYTNTSVSTGTQVSAFAGLSETAAAARMLEIVKPIAVRYGLFPSVITGRAILESGFCTTELAQKANNVLGMKSDLINSQWSGRSWDGKSQVLIHTPEQDKDGKTFYIDDWFRVYACIEDCIADICAFFTSLPKYNGIKKCKSYAEQITFIRSHGYATDVAYDKKVVSIIERLSLNKYDSTTAAESDQDKVKQYIVQAGSFSKKTNAKKLVEKLKAAGFPAIIK